MPVLSFMHSSVGCSMIFERRIHGITVWHWSMNDPCLLEPEWELFWSSCLGFDFSYERLYENSRTNEAADKARSASPAA